MANRLDPINMVDFSGGLNTRASPFQLGENETPETLNVSADRLGGIYSRAGWDLWTTNDPWSELEAWDPRRAYLHSLSSGDEVVYVAANDTVYGSHGGQAVDDLVIPCGAETHLVDFAALGDTVYIACGREFQSHKRVGTAAPTALTASGAANWNDDYTAPVGGKMPKAEVCESHGGYLFVANLEEDGVDQPNRIRWSHPTSTEDWAALDFIDIASEGDRITALMSFQDHLLVFKTSGVWAIYGYDADSWQVIKKSTTLGVPGPQAVTRSETAVFFYSASDHGGIYAYTGEMPEEIAQQLRGSINEIVHRELVWVGWLQRKLWVTVPWSYEGAANDSAGVFVYDPAVGDAGCWMFYTSMAGGLGPLVGGSNIDSALRPMGVLRNTESPCIVMLDANEAQALDRVTDISAIAATGSAGDVWEPPALMNDLGELIIASGSAGAFPFRTAYRTPWLTAGWPTRKKSFRRPDFVCRRTGITHRLQIQSFRDYEEISPRRQHTLQIDGSGISVWGEFDWGDGTTWGAGAVAGNKIVRGGGLGLCKSMQLRLVGLTPGARWGIDAIVLKLVMRRFH